MSVQFYARRPHGKTVCFWDGGYGRYNALRCSLAALFDFPLAIAFGKLPEMRSESEAAAMRDISPWVPMPAWTLFSSEDCGGSWTADEVAAFVPIVMSRPAFFDERAWRQMLHDAACSAESREAYEKLVPWIERLDRSRPDGIAFIHNLSYFAGRRCRIHWS